MIFGISWSWLAFVLPLVLDSVEGFEAALLVASQGPKIGWGRGAVAAAAGFLTAGAVGTGIYFLDKVVPPHDVDYAIGAFIFLLGTRELINGLRARQGNGSEGESQSQGQGKQQGQQGQQRQQNSGQQGANGDSGSGQKAGSWLEAWPMYFGTTLETSEAILYTIAVSHTHSGFIAPAIGGAIGFTIPWVALIPIRRWANATPEWQRDTSIGIVLMAASTTFITLRAAGVL